MRLTRGSSGAAAILAVTAAVVPVTSAAAAPAGAQVPHSGPQPGSRAAVRVLRHTELAYIAHGNLFLLGGPVREPRRVNLPGTSFAPVWSADHRWLAVLVSPPRPATATATATPGQPGLDSLWLVNAAGTVSRPLTPASWDVTGFAWAPRAALLAVTASRSGVRPSRSWVVLTVTPGGRRTVLAAAANGTGVGWSPDGRQIAAGLSTLRGRRWAGRLTLLRPRGGRPATVAVSKGNVIELAGWWPDGSGLLYWVDPQGSSSIAADGLPLFTLALRAGQAAGRPRRLVASMLVHSSWVAFRPGGHQVAVVAGGDREIWGGRKHLVLCATSGRCRVLTKPAGTVDLQPEWSAAGRAVLFTRASASGPFGPGGHALFSPKWIRRWQATSRMRLIPVAGTGGRPITAAGRGAVDPVQARDGSVMFVRSDAIWILPAGAAAPVRLAGPLGALGPAGYAETYYGYVPYPQLIAWTGARPSRTAGLG